LRSIEDTQSNPHQEFDYAGITTTGIPYHVRIVGPVAIFLWVDHAACEVKILDVVDADSGL
jgi:hypothetical protein